MVPGRGRGQGLGKEGEGRGRGSRTSREYGIKFHTLISRKRLEITLSIRYANLKSRGRSVDSASFQNSGTTSMYKWDCGSRSEFGPCVMGMFGNDSFPHQRTLIDEVFKPVNAESNGRSIMTFCDLCKLSILFRTTSTRRYKRVLGYFGHAWTERHLSDWERQYI